MLQLDRRMLELIGNQLQIGEESPEYFLRIKRVEEVSMDPYEWTGVPKGAMSIDIGASTDSGSATATVKIEDTYGLMSPRMLKPHEGQLKLTPPKIVIKPNEEAQYYAYVMSELNSILVGGPGVQHPEKCKWKIVPMGSSDTYGHVENFVIDNGKVTNTTLPNGEHYAECYVTATYNGVTVQGELLVYDDAYIVDIPNPIFMIRDNEEQDGDWFYFELNNEPLLFTDQATVNQLGYGTVAEDPDYFYAGIEVKADDHLNPSSSSFIGWNSGRYNEFPKKWTEIPLKLKVGINKLRITATWNGRRPGGGGNCTGNAQITRPDSARTPIYTEDGANGTQKMESIYMQPLPVNLSTGETTYVGDTSSSPQAGLYDLMHGYSSPRQTVTWLIEYRPPKDDDDPEVDIKDLVIDDPSKYFDFEDDELLSDYTASHYLNLIKPENFCQIGLGYGDTVIPVITGAIDTVSIDSKASTLTFTMRDNMRYLVDQTINALKHGKQLTYPKADITVSGSIEGANTVNSCKKVSLSGTVPASIRTGPNSQENLIGMLNPNQKYTYLGTTNGWHCIMYGNSCGYVDGRLTTITESASSMVGEIPLGPEQLMVRIHSDLQYAPIYSQPVTTSTELGRALHDETYPYIRTVENGTFYNIDYNGMSGYVRCVDSSQTTENTDGSTNVAKYQAHGLPAEWYLKSQASNNSPNTDVRVYNGDMLDIISMDGDWRKVKYSFGSETPGYIHKDNVTLVYVPTTRPGTTTARSEWRATDIVMDLAIEATTIRCFETNPLLDRTICNVMIEDYYVDMDGELASYTIPTKSFPLSESYFDACMEIVNMMGRVSLRCTRFGDIALRKRRTYTQLDNPNWLITDYVDLTALTHKNDVVDTRNRVIIKSDNGWNMYEHPLITKEVCKGVNRTTCIDVGSMGVDEPTRRIAANNFFEQILSRYYTMSIAIKGNPLIELDQCVELRDLVSGANEKYCVREYKHQFTSEGFITQLELDYIATLDPHDLIMLTDNFPDNRDTFNYKQYMSPYEQKSIKFKYATKVQKAIIRIKRQDTLFAEISIVRDIQEHTETTQTDKKYVLVEHNQINARYSPSSYSSDNIKRKVNYGFYGEYLGTSGSWYELKDYDGTAIYVWAAYCSIKEGGSIITTSSTTTTTAPLNQTGGTHSNSCLNTFINTLKAEVGVARYVYGGYNPSSHIFDCSSFISWGLVKCGLKPQGYRGTTLSIWDECAEISKSEVRPGDLVFIRTGAGGTSEHIGACIASDGTCIDCSSSNGGPIIRNINALNWNKFGRFPGLNGLAVYNRTDSTTTVLPEGTNTEQVQIDDHYTITSTFLESSSTQACINKAIELNGNVLCETDGCVLYNVAIESEGDEAENNVIKLYWASTNSSPVTLDLTYDIITYSITDTDVIAPENVVSDNDNIGTNNMSTACSEIWSFIVQYANENSLDAYWIAALIAEESSFTNAPVNSAGAIGYMQILPSSAQGVGVTGDLTDPATNIKAGCKLFRYYLDTAKSQYGAIDESNTLGKQYMYAQLLYGCWTNESAWSTAAEGYLAYNKVRRIYKLYKAGTREIGSRCDADIADLSALGSMDHPETD